MNTLFLELCAGAGISAVIMIAGRYIYDMLTIQRQLARTNQTLAAAQYEIAQLRKALDGFVLKR